MTKLPELLHLHVSAPFIDDVVTKLKAVGAHDFKEAKLDRQFEGYFFSLENTPYAAAHRLDAILIDGQRTTAPSGWGIDYDLYNYEILFASGVENQSEIDAVVKLSNDLGYESRVLLDDEDSILE